MARMAWLTMLLAIGIPAHADWPGDAANGKKLHDADCTGCHNDGVYTRKNRQIQSRSALEQQLSDCAHAAQKSYSAGQQQDLTKFLNQRYYHFK